MHVVILIAVFIVSAYYALSIPPVGEEFSPRRKKFNKICQLILVLMFWQDMQYLGPGPQQPSDEHSG